MVSLVGKGLSIEGFSEFAVQHLLERLDDGEPSAFSIG